MPKPTSFIDRNFRTVCLLVFLILFVPLMGREWYSLRSEGLYEVRWYTTSMAKLLERDLGDKQNLPLQLSLLNNPQRYDDFDRHVRLKLGHLGLLGLKIYDLSGKIVYALDRDLVGKVFPAGEGRKAALSGEVVTELVDQSEYYEEYQQRVSIDLAEAFVPIMTAAGEVSHILEAYYDYSQISRRNRTLLLKSALSLLLTILLAMGLLVYLYNKLHRMSRKVEALEAMLPICMHCKKIQVKQEDRPDEWMNVETYFARQDDLSFTHGICNDCLKKHYPDSKTAKKIAQKS